MAWDDDLEAGTPAYDLAAIDAATIRAVAGPGSGKSFGIKRRVARLLESGVAPSDILAITFTRNAAKDLKNEIESLGIPGADEVHSGTIHSLALRILMQADVLERTGRTPRMVIDHEIAPALRDIADEKYGDIRAKRKLLSEYLAAWASLQTDVPGYAKAPLQGEFESELIRWLRGHRGMLVGEVIPVAIQYLRNNPAAEIIGRYKVILVDEYQDLNKSEQEFIRLIRGNGDAVIVGDDDQSIYGFKFAHPEGIREVEALHGKFADVPFEECRRCPQQVTRMASELIHRNPNRTLGELKPRSENPGGDVQVIQWPTYDDEIAGLASLVQGEIASGKLTPEDILILAPRRRVGYRLRDAILAKGVPVKSYFRESAIEKDTVRRAYSLFYLLARPDDGVSLRYLLGYGSADFRRAQYERLQDISRNQRISVFQVLNDVLEGKISATHLTTIVAEYRQILQDLSSLRKQIADTLADALQNQFVATEDDEFEFYELDQLYRKAVEVVGEPELAKDPGQFSSWYSRVFDKLEESVVMPELPDVVDHVRIMSLHSSKGLSSRMVIVCSMIDDLIPYLPETLSDEEKESLIEEQRRLVYVALTRCKADPPHYDGKLIVSSFVKIYGLDAARMGISCNPKWYLKVMASRFLGEFGDKGPTPTKGSS